MPKSTQLQYDHLAPDLQVTMATGERIQLSSLWTEKAVLLAFTRHFGCPQCKEMLSLLVAAKGEIEKSSLTPIIVTQGTPAEAVRFCTARAPGMICISDPDREVYRAYRLQRGGVWQVALSPGVIWRTLRAGRSGHYPEMPPEGQDVMQMSGIFIIGTDGRIRLPYYYDNIADHAPLDLLLKGVFTTDWSKPFSEPLEI